MTFLAYPQYKDSGIESLGEIPSHWDVTRLPYVIFENNAGEVIDKNFWGDGSELLYTCAKQPLLSDFRDFPARKRTGANDLLLTRNGTPYVHLPSEGAIYSNVVQRVSLIPGIDRKFMRSALDVATRDLVGYGVSIASFNYEMWAALRIPLPDYEEQTQIARFLDHETARIDALIEEQQRLIELLKEKRQAVISHAVTKGLDPTVPMKDSGVEWLGEVPAHWDVKKLKHFGRVVGGFAFKSTDFSSDGHPVLKISNVGHLCFEWGDQSYLPDEFRESHSEFIAPKGALVFAMTRPVIAGGIKVARLEDDSLPLVNQRVGFMVIHDLDLSRYVLLSTQSDPFLSQFKNNLTITNQPNISSEGIESISIAVPPLIEMKDILAFCLKVDAEVQSLIGDALRGTELLQERRSALISAAVTGKIDVRGWQPPASTQTPESAVAEVH